MWVRPSSNRMASTTSEPTFWPGLSPSAIATLRNEVGACGFTAVPAPFPADLFEDLVAEAADRAPHSIAAEQEEPVPYRSRISELGPGSLGFLTSQPLSSFLTEIFDAQFELSEERSCVTSYAPGDHLGIHRDSPDACRVTVIVYLNVVRPATGPQATGPELRVYGSGPQPSSEPEPIIPTRAGDLVIGRGSTFWHARPKLSEGEHVTAITACFSDCGTPDVR